MTQTLNVGARSLFVTATAWLFIVLAVLACVSAVLQNAEVDSVLPAWRAGGEALQPFTRLLMGYLPWVMGAGLLLSGALLACAVGLLLRLEWARRVFIGLLVVVILGNLAGLWLQHEVVHGLLDSTLRRGPLTPQAADVVGGFATATQAMGLVVTLTACAFLGWVIRRLMSDTVRQEFA